MRRLSLSWKLLLPALGIIVAVNIGVIWYVGQNHDDILMRMGNKVARTAVTEIEALRSFYAKEVVPRAESGGMKVNYDFESQEATLPLPATFVKAIGKHLNKSHPGADVELFSDFPFPNGANRPIDDFKRAALTNITQKGDSFSRIEEVDGRLSVRYAIPDLMRQSCVACHNSHPLSPKTDWKVGDVRGILAVTVPVEDVAATIASSMWALILAIGSGSLLLGAGLFHAVRRIVSIRLRSMAKSLDEIRRDNDLERRLEDRHDDEISKLAGTFNDLFGAMGGLVREVVGSAGSIDSNSTEIVSTAMMLAQNVQDQTGSLESISGSLGSIEGNARNNAEQVEVAMNLGHDNQRIADRGQQEVVAMTEAMEEIQTSSSEIGEVVRVIDDIAFQTNLLALNASVEAARAGDAGKGFAVVADEVRGLAMRSAEAASTITEMIATSATRAKRGADLSGRVREALGEIVAGSNKVTSVLEGVASSSGEQVTCIEGFRAGIDQIDSVTRQSVGSGTAITDAAHQMSDHATRLRELTVEFQMAKPS